MTATGQATAASPRGDGAPAGVQRRVTVYVTGLVCSAGVLAALVALSPTGVADSSVAMGVILWVALVAMSLIDIRAELGAGTESTTFVEVAAVPVMVLVEPGTAVALAVAASIVSETIRCGRELRKVAFNTAWLVAGVALGAWAYRAIAGDGMFDAGPAAVGGALVAGAVLVTTNHLALSGVFSVLDGARFRDVLFETAPVAIRDNGGAAVIGLLVAVLILEAPAASPLLLLLALMLRRRQVSRADVYARLAAERDRFQRTVAGSSDGVVLIDAGGTIEVWNPAMVALTGVPEDDAVGRDLAAVGWSRLTGSGHGDEEELRLPLADRVLAVRRATVAGRTLRSTSSVVTVRDVSREAELARIREDLVSRISHELRTPLTSMEGFLEVLTEHWDGLGDDGRRELVQASRRGSRRLSRLVANLMVWAGIETRSGDQQAGSEPVEPITVLRGVLDDLPADDVQLEVEDDTAVLAAEDDVRIILANLLSNATLYGASPVSVAIRRRGDEVEIAVADAGPGLPPEFRARLFEPFAQASDGLRRTAKGLGMGLAIVRSLAVGNGGRVDYDEVPGGGARFRIALPAAAGARTAPVPRERYDATGVSSSSR